MIQDNQWHTGFVYQHSDDGGFTVAETIEQIGQDKRPKTMEHGGVKYQEVKYNWRNGRPLVDFGDFKMEVQC